MLNRALLFSCLLGCAFLSIQGGVLAADSETSRTQEAESFYDTATSDYVQNSAVIFKAMYQQNAAIIDLLEDIKGLLAKSLQKDQALEA